MSVRISVLSSIAENMDKVLRGVIHPKISVLPLSSNDAFYIEDRSHTKIPIIVVTVHDSKDWHFGATAPHLVERRGHHGGNICGP